MIPNLLKGGKRVFAYDFAKNIIPGVGEYEEKGYWRDVGTIQAFWDAHQDMLGENPVFDVNNFLWPVRASRNDLPATRIFGGEIINSIIAEGTVIKSARIINSVVRRGVVIEDDVEVRDSIIMDHVTLKKGSMLNRTIVDSYNVIEENVVIGHESAEPYFRAAKDASGIYIVASEKQTGRL